MTRIIAGAAGGRRLRSPRGERTRPTTDRVREALFSAVESWVGSTHGSWADVRVLDLYAGSGALGLEAASRGAASVTAVERDRATARLIAQNVDDLALGGVEVRAEAVRRVLDGVATPGRAARFDLVLADPPYPLGEEDLARDLAALGEWLARPALVVLERSSRSPQPRWPAAVAGDRSRRYGETTLWYGRAAAPTRSAPEPPGSPGPTAPTGVAP